MQTLSNGAVRTTNGKADVFVQNKAKTTPLRKILPMTEIDSTLQNGQSRPGVAKVLSTLMIPQVMSHTNERMTVSNGVSNGTFRLISTKSPENKIIHHISNSVLQTLRSNASISSSNIRVISKRSVAMNGSPVDVVFKSPVSISKEMLTKSLSKEMLTKRMKITTVAKRVPLINTVGNQSKLTPLTVPSPMSSETPAGSKSEVITKPMSILEARLTSATSNVPTSAANVPAKTGRDKEISSSDVSVSSLSDDPDSNLSKLLRTLEGDCDSKVRQSVALQSSEASRKASLNLSFEKGVTRLVAVEARTVTMVDVSTQVFMPQCEEQGSGVQNPVDTSSLHAELMEISGCSQPPAMKSVVSPPQKQFVIVDTKDGKKVVAIPKQIINSYSGPKTFIIEGKSLKRKADFVDELISKRPKSPPKDPSVSQSSTFSSVNLKNEYFSNVGIKSQLSASSPNCRTVTSPSSTETLSTQSCKLSSLQQSQASNRTSDTTVVCMPSSTKSCQSDLLGSDSDDSDSIVLPLNLPIETAPSNLSDNTSVQVHPDASSMFILAPNETHQELKYELGPIPGVAEYVTKQVLQTDKSRNDHITFRGPVPDKKWVQLSDVMNQKLDFPAGMSRCESSLKMGSFNGHRRDPLVSPKMSLAMEGLNSVVYAENQGPRIQEHSASFVVASDASNVNGCGKETSKEEVDKFVKNAFTDFKNCLVFNHGKLPIHDAVENNNDAAVKRQCIVLRSRKVSVDITNSKEETPLQLALYYGHSTLVPLLLQHGADATVLDREGNSTLHLAVTYAEDSLKYLLTCGQFSKSSINGLNDEGFSALHLAAQSNKVSCIRLLVKYGAAVDLPDGKSGRTALFHAVERKYQDTQELLVSLGADSREASYTGCTPNHVTRSDAMAQFSTSIQDEIIKQIKSDPLLKLPTQPKSHIGVK